MFERAAPQGQPALFTRQFPLSRTTQTRRDMCLTISVKYCVLLPCNSHCYCLPVIAIVIVSCSSIFCHTLKILVTNSKLTRSRVLSAGDAQINVTSLPPPPHTHTHTHTQESPTKQYTRLSLFSFLICTVGFKPLPLVLWAKLCSSHCYCHVV